MGISFDGLEGKIKTFPAWQKHTDVNRIIRNEAVNVHPANFDLAFVLDLKKVPPVTKLSFTPNPLLTSYASKETMLRVLIKEVVFNHLMQNSWRAGANTMIVSTGLQRSCVLIDVKDNGCGIERKNIGSLFNLGATFVYRNPKGPVKGTGRGLFDSHVLAKSVNASIELLWNRPVEECDWDHGAAFRLRIPLNGKKKG